MEPHACKRPQHARALAKRRETRGDEFEDEARGRWAVRPRTGLLKC